jgi:hypothetical protein
MQTEATGTVDQEEKSLSVSSTRQKYKLRGELRRILKSCTLMCLGLELIVSHLDTACSVHLLQKAIKLMLPYPSEQHYRQFFQ